MVSRMFGTLSFNAPDFAAKKMINENARKSGGYISHEGSAGMKTIRIQAHHIRARWLYTLSLGLCSA